MSNNNVLDFESRKSEHELKRKEAKVEKIRDAFRAARGEPETDTRAARRRSNRAKKKPKK